MPIDWTSCPPDPLAWFGLRGPLLHVLFTPWLLSLLLESLFAGLLVVLPLPLRWWSRGLIVISGVLLVNAIYSPLATESLSGWLASQFPAPVERLEHAPLPVAVLVGRGPKIAQATSKEAARLLKQHTVQAVYVSGDQRSTAQRVVDAGAPAERVAGDSCARTTWENATRTNTWLQAHHPGVPVLLLPDPWQLPRAVHAFAHQGLRVLPLALAMQLRAAGVSVELDGSGAAFGKPFKRANHSGGHPADQHLDAVHSLRAAITFFHLSAKP